jgi:hypothetical protein
MANKNATNVSYRKFFIDCCHTKEYVTGLLAMPIIVVSLNRANLTFLLNKMLIYIDRVHIVMLNN